MTEQTTDPVEALAESWASIDGKLERFRANKADRSLDRTDGSYPGYMKDARSLREQLALRGFVIVPGQMFKSFPEKPDAVNVREFVEALDGKR